ncbi:M48 family metalloprotease [Amycolatopsis methanolica]|uniref:M48 family metalloprotease n=1 Tax=Amycolatopsis methanolica TaxID=1814 RepID=UPI0034220093
MLPNEPGINAFAAGWTRGDAAIAVTQGALDRLSRDELPGVIAHEFSHVVNGDMRLNIWLMGVLTGILGLALLGRILLPRGGGRRQAGSLGPLVLPALVAVIAGYVGVVLGRLIKAGVSRQREFLADASAVQFTRQTEGLAGALKKIAGLPTGSRLHTAKAEDVSHMLFGDSRKFSSLFATHPPLVRRIQLLDPAFDPRELDQLSSRWAPVILGLLLSAHPQIRTGQHQLLTARLGRPLADAAWREGDALRGGSTPLRACRSRNWPSPRCASGRSRSSRPLPPCCTNSSASTGRWTSASTACPLCSSETWPRRRTTGRRGRSGERRCGRPRPRWPFCSPW